MPRKPGPSLRDLLSAVATRGRVLHLDELAMGRPAEATIVVDGRDVATRATLEAVFGPELLEDAHAWLQDQERRGRFEQRPVEPVQIPAGDALAVRRSYGAFWAAARARLAGLPAALPRLWHV